MKEFCRLGRRNVDSAAAAAAAPKDSHLRYVHEMHKVQSRVVDAINKGMNSQNATLQKILLIFRADNRNIW
jgi:hypothetical protein